MGNDCPKTVYRIGVKQQHGKKQQLDMFPHGFVYGGK